MSVTEQFIGVMISGGSHSNPASDIGWLRLSSYHGMVLM